MDRHGKLLVLVSVGVSTPVARRGKLGQPTSRFRDISLFPLSTGTPQARFVFFRDISLFPLSTGTLCFLAHAGERAPALQANGAEKHTLARASCTC